MRRCIIAIVAFLKDLPRYRFADVLSLREDILHLENEVDQRDADIALLYADRNDWRANAKLLEQENAGLVEASMGRINQLSKLVHRFNVLEADRNHHRDLARQYRALIATAQGKLDRAKALINELQEHKAAMAREQDRLCRKLQETRTLNTELVDQIELAKVALFPANAFVGECSSPIPNHAAACMGQPCGPTCKPNPAAAGLGPLGPQTWANVPSQFPPAGGMPMPIIRNQ